MAETLFNILKISVIIAISAVFMVAINALIGFINTIVLGGVITEVFQLISMYLPFNGFAVFNAMATSITAIFSFLIAKKIFDLTSWGVSTV